MLDAAEQKITVVLIENQFVPSVVQKSRCARQQSHRI